MSKFQQFDEQRQRSLGIVAFVIASVLGVGLLIAFASFAISVLTA